MRQRPAHGGRTADDGGFHPLRVYSVRIQQPDDRQGRARHKSGQGLHLCPGFTGKKVAHGHRGHTIYIFFRGDEPFKPAPGQGVGQRPRHQNSVYTFIGRGLLNVCDKILRPRVAVYAVQLCANPQRLGGLHFFF